MWGHTGCNGVDNRRFINAVFWILRIAARRRERRGGTCRMSMVIGRMRIGDLRDGETVEFETKY